jgi:predicted acyltransferase
MGLAQLPLVCVMFRILGRSAKYLLVRHRRLPLVDGRIWCLVVATNQRDCLGTMLQRIALAKLLAAPEVSQTP